MGLSEAECLAALAASLSGICAIATSIQNNPAVSPQRFNDVHKAACYGVLQTCQMALNLIEHG